MKLGSEPRFACALPKIFPSHTVKVQRDRDLNRIPFSSSQCARHCLGNHLYPFCSCKPKCLGEGLYQVVGLGPLAGTYTELENPRDKAAWWAAACGVYESDLAAAAAASRTTKTPRHMLTSTCLVLVQNPTPPPQAAATIKLCNKKGGSSRGQQSIVFSKELLSSLQGLMGRYKLL